MCMYIYIFIQIHTSFYIYIWDSLSFYPCINCSEPMDHVHECIYIYIYTYMPWWLNADICTSVHSMVTLKSQIMVGILLTASLNGHFHGSSIAGHWTPKHQRIKDIHPIQPSMYTHNAYIYIFVYSFIYSNQKWKNKYTYKYIHVYVSPSNLSEKFNLGSIQVLSSKNHV